MKQITKRLIIGISAIVLISTTLIIGIFMSQYKSMLLKQQITEITSSANEIARFSTSIIQQDDQLNEKSPVSQLINGLINSNLWIINKNNQVILSTTSFTVAEEARNQIITDIKKIKKDATFITYDYSGFLGEEYVSAIKPIVENEKISGYVILHKQIDNIYDNSGNLYFLVLISVAISIVLSIGLGVFYSLRFTKPIQRMTVVAKKISEGDYKIKTNIVQNDEIGVLALMMDNMTEKLDANITEIKRLEESAKELVATVSHEFKTPLTIIRGHVENLQEGIESNTSKTYDKILNNTKVLDRLVNELLDLNKYQNGKVELKIEKLELIQVVSDVVSDIKMVADLKDINIVTKVKGSNVKLLEADYIKFKQLITIIIDNAIKFSPKKSNIYIKIEDDKITIKDSGKGISKEDLNHIFERFYRSDDGNDGYGLGLCIAKYIADKHGFTIDITSTKGRGTKVVIDL